MEDNTNTKKLTLELIDGTFLPNETMEIINHIIQKKINFHELRNFSETIRFGIDNNNSTQRISTLLSHQNELANYIEKSIGKDQLLDIKATISIELH